jgi:prepilin-type processing-associated H-X9-DG protein
MLTYNWSSINGGYVYDGQPKPHLSAHLNGLIPLGGNIGMLDGHVEWRNFTNMQARADGTPYFYW